MILITGGAGYIGAHTNKALHNAGYETVVVDNLCKGYETFVKWGNFENYDFGNKNLREVFEKYDIDGVIHFAAFSSVAESVEFPQKYFKNNYKNTLNLLQIMREFGVDKFNSLHSFDHADGSYHLMGCMLSAASCNKWWMEDIIKTQDFGAEQNFEDKLGENHVFFLPYLMGERCPHNNPDARAAFIGMTMDSTREDMTQAVLEGVAFGLRDSLEVARDLGISIERTKLCGGGAKSPIWRKIIAAVMNMPVDIPVSEEGPSMGGAMLAAVACGEYGSVQDIAGKLVRVKETIEPDKELVAKYEAKYRQFKQMYPALKPIYDAIKA